MKLTKYILGLALVAAGLTSCDQDNVGAIYEPNLEQPNITFVTEAQDILTEESSIEVPVAITRSVTKGEYTAKVTLSDESEGVSLMNNQVTFADGEGIAYATIVVTGMVKGQEYSGTLTLSDADIATENTEFGEAIHSTTVSVMCDYNWLSAGTCTCTDYTWENGYSAENVPVQNAEGTNIYRIVSPLAYVYDASYVDGQGDTANWQFTLNDDGSISIPEGASLNYWGYYMYYTSSYPGYCFVEQDGNTYMVNFLLLNGTSLYTGGYFEFTWDR